MQKINKSSPVNTAFVEFMSESIIQVKNIETFKNFKFLFEAIIGFYEKKILEKIYILQNKIKKKMIAEIIQYKNKHNG